jgi:hypothetical protein
MNTHTTEYDIYSSLLIKTTVHHCAPCDDEVGKA